MHESHLEPIEARPQSKCAQIWSKLSKNLLLTLTVLGKSPLACLSYNRNNVVLCKKARRKKKHPLAFPTTEHRVLVIQSIIMPLACHVRRRSHLCSLRQPDCGMFGCLDLLWLSRHLLVFRKLSAALDKQPSGSAVIKAGSRGSTPGGLMRKEDKSSNEG